MSAFCQQASQPQTAGAGGSFAISSWTVRRGAPSDDGRLLIHVSNMSGRFGHAGPEKLVSPSMRSGRTIMLAMLLAAAALGTVAPRMADARDQDQLRRDEVRRAVESGEIHSLAEILDALRGKLPGEVAGVEIERKGDRWRY